MTKTLRYHQHGWELEPSGKRYPQQRRYIGFLTTISKFHVGSTNSCPCLAKLTRSSNPARLLSVNVSPGTLHYCRMMLGSCLSQAVGGCRPEAIGGNLNQSEATGTMTTTFHG